VDGWKAFFKTLVFLLREHETDIVKLDFENTIYLLNKLVCCDYFSFTFESSAIEHIKIRSNMLKIKSTINSIKITNTLLGFLQD